MTQNFTCMLRLMGRVETKALTQDAGMSVNESKLVTQGVCSYKNCFYLLDGHDKSNYC